MFRPSVVRSITSWSANTLIVIGPLPLQFRENRELCRAQARRREVLIVKLGDVPRGLTDSQAGALFELRFKVL